MKRVLKRMCYADRPHPFLCLKSIYMKPDSNKLAPRSQRKSHVAYQKAIIANVCN